MAGSRVHKIGTIFSRTKGLLRSGALSQSEKPLWYDLYEAFPPRVEPSFGRTVEEDVPIRNILYAEDSIRAKFYKTYPSYGTLSLNENNDYPPACNLFVEEYLRLQAEGELSGEELITKAALALESRGVYLERPNRQERGASRYVGVLDGRVVSNEDDEPPLSLKEVFSAESNKIKSEDSK